MKTMFENMISLIVTMILIFVFVGIISVETQVINARNIHSRVVEVYQNSNHTISSSYFNSVIHDGNIVINENADRDSEVILTYNVKLPFLNISDEQRIVGYAK